MVITLINYSLSDFDSLSLVALLTICELAASAAFEIGNAHAALYAGPPQDVFGRGQHEDDPKSSGLTSIPESPSSEGGVFAVVTCILSFFTS
jgi:hypothetical protein